MRADIVRRIALRFIEDVVDRRSPPGACAGDAHALQAERVELAEAVEEVIPSGMETDDIARALNSGVKRTRQRQRHRGWPSAMEIKQFAELLFNDTTAPDNRHPSEYAPVFIDWAARLVQRGQVPPTKYWSEEFARHLLDISKITPDELAETGWLDPQRREQLGLPPADDAYAPRRIGDLVAGTVNRIEKERRMSAEQFRQRQRELTEELAAEITEELRIERDIQLWEARKNRAGLDPDAQATAELRLKELRAQLTEIRDASA